MTVIRIDPVELEEVASLLDTTAREYESLSAVFSSPDLGSMPANIAGIVGQAYAEARSTVTALASELVSEARVLRFRGATAAEEGGLGCHLGSLGGLGYADTSSSFLSPFDTALVGSLATAWSGLLVGAQAVASGTGIAFGGTAFASGSTTASGGQLNFSSSSVMLGGGEGSTGTTVYVGGGYDPGYSFVMPNPLGSETSSAGTTLMIGGGYDPGYSFVMPNPQGSFAGSAGTTLMVGGGVTSSGALSFNQVMAQAFSQNQSVYDGVVTELQSGTFVSDPNQPQLWGPWNQAALGRALNMPDAVSYITAPNGLTPRVDFSGDSYMYNSNTGRRD